MPLGQLPGGRLTLSQTKAAQCCSLVSCPLRLAVLQLRIIIYGRDTQMPQRLWLFKKTLQPFMANPFDKSVQCLNPSAAHRIFRCSLEQQRSSCNNCHPHICIPNSQDYKVFYPKRKRNFFLNCLAAFPRFLLEGEGNCRLSAAELILKCLKCFK